MEEVMLGEEKAMDDSWKIQKLKELGSYLVFIVVIALLLSYQIRKHTAIVVADGYFHFSRFYDAAMQIKYHNFSAFQMNYGFNQSGRIINALYGPLFSYLMGIILLLAGTWLRFQIITSALISFFAANGIYQCLRKVSKNNIINTLISLVYMTQVNFWSNGSTFNSISAMLMPYAILCALRMVQDKEKPISWLQLGLTMSIIIQVHVLTTVMSVLVLIPFAIAGLVQTEHKKNMIVNLLLAVVLTLLLTANVWTVMLYFHVQDIVSNPVAVNMSHAVLRIHKFSILVLILIVFQYIYSIFNWKKSKLNLFILVIASIFWLIGSKIFPWNFVQHIFPVLREAFQFPSRLFMVVLPLLLLSIGMTLTDLFAEKGQLTRITIIAFLALAFLENYTNILQKNYFYTTNSLMTATKINRGQRKSTRSLNLKSLFKYLDVPAPDYLPQVHKISSKKKVKLYRKLIKNSKKFKHTVLSDARLKLTWNGKKVHKRQLPIVMYRHSNLMLNGKIQTDIKKNAIGVPSIIQQKGKNTAILSYINPKWWNLVIIISLFSWFSVIILLLYQWIVNLNKI